jgi:hypothetical protein
MMHANLACRFTGCAKSMSSLNNRGGGITFSELKINEFGSGSRAYLINWREIVDDMHVQIWDNTTARVSILRIFTIYCIIIYSFQIDAWIRNNQLKFKDITVNLDVDGPRIVKNRSLESYPWEWIAGIYTRFTFFHVETTSMENRACFEHENSPLTSTLGHRIS